jgi:c-di-GMP-binding flagellar brake protein YcgR
MLAFCDQCKGFYLFRETRRLRFESSPGEGAMELRQSPRFPVQIPVSFSGDKIVWHGTVSDLSTGGCKVVSDPIILEGSKVVLRAHLPSQASPVQVEVAKVRWSRGQEFGLEFLYMKPEERARLTHFIETLETQPTR